MESSVKDRPAAVKSQGMSVEEAIRTRRSVHHFKPGQKIAAAAWRKLFELTALSPSSWNFQPWDFVIVEDQARRAALFPLCWNQSQVTDSAGVIAVIGDLNPHRRDHQILQQFQDNGYIDEQTKNVWLGAVDVVYPDEKRKIEHAIGGSSLAAMTLMLAAQSMGLATAPLIGFDPAGVTKFLGVPDGYLVTMLIAIGYAAHDELPRQQRRTFEEIVRWDRF